MIRKLLERMPEKPGDAEGGDVPINDRTAGRHIVALHELRRLLRTRGIRTLAIDDRYRLTLKAAGRGSASRLERHPPELVVYAEQGRRAATVRMAPRSGEYVVEVRVGGLPLPDRPLPRLAALPQEAAELILEHIAGTP
ncbi:MULTISPECIES: hypothetical protein [unclassified Nonomuraea]|uniref:hypothetical protein n=1 Tax=unclassified Nonomuraea TaxID=2593643 RepID=UPI0033EB4239